MVCKSHVASYVSCGENLYDPKTETCISPSKVNKASYCTNRPNGDYNWPWNCHKFVTCSNHYFYLFNCSTPELVYDPSSDTCKHPAEVTCQDVRGNSILMITKTN